jgi:SAM-dependent methyltransferase
MLDLYPANAVSDYRDIFDLRGQLYHEAMHLFPDARAQEFQNVIAAAEITPRMMVVDVPSGGAYLSRYLTGVDLVGLEVSSSFAELAAQHEQKVILYDNERFPLGDACADRVLSIAGLHHIEHKGPMFAEMRRVLKPTGRLVVADVAEGSAVRGFLDEFVGKYCDTGHSGWYFGDATRTELADTGLEIVQDKLLDYLWCAPDMQQLASFCRLLFGMIHADIDTVAGGIVDHLGICELENGVGMNWQLHSFTCRPAANCTETK